jgi:hypothetical protein
VVPPVVPPVLCATPPVVALVPPVLATPPVVAKGVGSSMVLEHALRLANKRAAIADVRRIMDMRAQCSSPHSPHTTVSAAFDGYIDT